MYCISHSFLTTCMHTETYFIIDFMLFPSPRPVAKIVAPFNSNTAACVCACKRSEKCPFVMFNVLFHIDFTPPSGSRSRSPFDAFVRWCAVARSCLISCSAGAPASRQMMGDELTSRFYKRVKRGMNFAFSLVSVG